ncbi:uncharacterized protein LOC143579837 [Bidens hawaiensis]|uniref:uncharacterized protein LOC143579837 n=1 Tax=Bidens hawaiensis TaxID=980011 RepID=UPI0040497E30
MLVYQSDLQSEFSKPMPWIGMYIALASLFCILAMTSDLVHGFRNKNLWFPCKYFTLNAASLTMIAVAMKLPVDLNNSMPGYVDQTAKLGSLAIMCTMMANSLPSLATMDHKELLTNVIALGFLVITICVNVCIQINTGVLSYYMDDAYSLENISDAKDLSSHTHLCDRSFIAIAYVVLLLMLLIIYVCTSLAILTSKQTLKLKNKVAHEHALNDLQSGKPTVEKLKQHVSNYWIMDVTSNSIYMTTCFTTTSASGVISIINTLMHCTTMSFMCAHVVKHNLDNKSDYKWSMLVILGIQFIGVIIATIAPIFRCFAGLSFRVSTERSSNHISVFKVESYWTQKLCDYEQNSVSFSTGGNIKILILRLCIGLQKKVVVVCKIIALIPVFFVICVLWFQIIFSCSWFGLVFRHAQKDTSINTCDNNRHDVETMELADTTVKKILNFVDSVIKKGEKQQPCNLMKLLERSRGFKGVEFFSRHHVPPLLSEELVNCWSLHVITLTSIVLSLPNIENDKVDTLLSSVSEGLVYVTLVEESLNATSDYISIRKAAKMLRLEVEVYHRWLGNKLQNHVPRLHTTRELLEWFRDTAKNMVIENQNDNTICANSMYFVSQKLLFSYRSNVERISQDELFEQLSSLIADTLAACLTNLPRVIATKCHKSEAGIHAAARLLGETKQIIDNLQDRELPSLNPDELPFIDKWHAYYSL